MHHSLPQVIGGLSLLIALSPMPVSIAHGLQRLPMPQDAAVACSTRLPQAVSTMANGM